MLQYLKTKEEREAFIDKYDNFLFDCDGKQKETNAHHAHHPLGVLWEGNRMFDGVRESMKLLREKGSNKGIQEGGDDVLIFL